MIYPSGDELEKKVDSKYSLVIAVAKRVKQLKEGAPKLIETKSRNPITIALEEIAADKLRIGLATPEEIEMEASGHHDVAEMLMEPEEQTPAAARMSEAEALRQALAASAESSDEEEETAEAEEPAEEAAAEVEPAVEEAAPVDEVEVAEPVEEAVEVTAEAEAAEVSVDETAEAESVEPEPVEEPVKEKPKRTRKSAKKSDE